MEYSILTVLQQLRMDAYIVHLESPSSGHLSTSTPDNGQPACPLKGQQSVQNYLQKRTETKTASINHKNTIKFLTFVTQIVCPLLCFGPCRACFDRDLLIQLLVGHTPLHKSLLMSSRLGVWPVSQPLR